MSTHSTTYQPGYGAYEAQRTDAHQQYGTSYTQEPGDEASDKIRAPRRDMRNMYRVTMAITSMLMLIPFALLFVVFMGGPQGWLGFGIAAFAIFLIAVVTIDKIQ